MSEVEELILENQMRIMLALVNLMPTPQLQHDLYEAAALTELSIKKFVADG